MLVFTSGMCGAGNQSSVHLKSYPLLLALYYWHHYYWHYYYWHHYYWHSKCLKNAQRKSSVHSPGMIKLNLGLCLSLSLSLSLCHNSAFMGLTVDVLEQIQPFLHIVKCFPLLCEDLRVCLKCLASDSSD